MTTIGIVMPAFNAVRWIREALKSVLEQTSAAWSLVIVDDGSADDTAHVAGRSMRYNQRGTERVHIYVRPHVGLPGAVNFGMARLAEQPDPPELVMCLSADDRLSENYVATMLAAHAAFPRAPAVYPPVREFGTRVCVWLPGEWYAGKVLGNNTVPVCGAWKRSVWDAVGGLDERFQHGSEDWFFAAKAEAMGLISAGTKPVYAPEASYFHRAHAESLTDRMTTAQRAFVVDEIHKLFQPPAPPKKRIIEGGGVLVGPYDLTQIPEPLV